MKQNEIHVLVIIFFWKKLDMKNLQVTNNVRQLDVVSWYFISQI